MKYLASISSATVRSTREFIVYGPASGLKAECCDLQQAKKMLDQCRNEAKQWNEEVDLAIFRWSDGHWIPAMSLYEIQERDLRRNPSAVVDLV